MTDKEKAIVMANTGICMLTGDKFQIFHKYVEEIIGRPVWTHEIGYLKNTIKEKSKADFIALCANESSSEKQNQWIPVSERLPEEGEMVLVWYEYFRWGDYNRMFSTYGIGCQYDNKWSVIEGGMKQHVFGWMPLPQPYEPQESEVQE